MNRYGHIFQSLNEAKVQYIVVGGVAMNLHGYTRFTGDLDILLALTSANLKRMTALMESEGYIRRIPVALDELGDEKNILRLMKEKNLLAYSFLGKDPQYNIDVIIGESLEFQKYEKHVVKIHAWDIVVPIISADDLIGMKKRAGRKKDNRRRSSSDRIERSMKPKTNFGFDLEYLRACKRSTPEQKLSWLQEAQEFVAEVRRSRAKSAKKAK